MGQSIIWVWLSLQFHEWYNQIGALFGFRSLCIHWHFSTAYMMNFTLTKFWGKKWLMSCRIWKNANLWRKTLDKKVVRSEEWTFPSIFQCSVADQFYLETDPDPRILKNIMLQKLFAMLFMSLLFRWAKHKCHLSFKKYNILVILVDLCPWFRPIICASVTGSVSWNESGSGRPKWNGSGSTTLFQYMIW